MTMTSSSMMVKSRAPIRYTTQAGVVRGWDGDSAGGGAGDTGGSGVGAGGSGDVDGGIVSAGAGCGAGDVASDDAVGVFDGDAEGGDSVVKAPAALQALRVSPLAALTFQ